MGKITENYNKLISSLPENVELVAVSKTKSPEEIMEVYQCGHRVFGESKAQELVPKYQQLPKDIKWHMVGHLQSNKVKHIAHFVTMIHSVDSFKLLRTINKEGKKHNRVIDCLLQMHIAEEDTKYGLDLQEAIDILSSEDFKNLQNIRIRGLMCMATFTENSQQVHREFQTLTGYFHTLKERFFKDETAFSERSMGMSNDFPIALKESSTMIRVGSHIFGERPPVKN